MIPVIARYLCPTEDARGMPEALPRWWDEHSQLDGLVARIEAALAGGRIDPANTVLSEFEEVLEAHFTLEETVYFPLVGRGELPAARRMLHRLLDGFRIHEDQEARLIGSLEAEL